METGDSDRDPDLQRQFFDLVLPLEGVKDGFDTVPRPVDLELANEGIPKGHIAFMGDFNPDNKGILLIAGKPASGKSAVSKKLISEWDEASTRVSISHLSTGDTLRAIASGELNSQFKRDVKKQAENLRQALPLPYSLVADVLLEALDAKTERLILLDGHPRYPEEINDTLGFARVTGRKILGLVEITVPDEVAKARMISRQKEGEKKFELVDVERRIDEYRETLGITILGLVQGHGLSYHELINDGTIEDTVLALGSIILSKYKPN